MAVLTPEAPPRREPSPSTYEIVRRKPSQLYIDELGEDGLNTGKKTLIPNKGMADLLKVGYDLPFASGTTLDKLLEDEYGGEDSRRAIYLAYEGSQLVGSLTLDLWTHAGSKEGKIFWQKLSELEKGMWGALQKTSPLAVEVVGLTMLPKKIGQGVDQQLWDVALADKQFSVALSMAKNADLVSSRASSLDSHGFETYFGRAEATPGHEMLFSTHAHSVREAYLVAKGYEIDKTGAIFIDSPRLRPSVPDISHASRPIAEAFGHLIRVQKAENEPYRGHRRIAVDTLISIKPKPFILSAPRRSRKAA